MDDLYALEGGGSATAWQKKHKRRKAREAALKARREQRAEVKADLKKRLKKWRTRWKADAASNKAAGLPPPSRHGRPRDLIKNYLDMTGWRFGLLTVLRVAPVSKNGAQRCLTWWVQCDCGSPEKRINGTTLRQRNSKSCGCYKSRRVRETHAKRREETSKLLAAPLSIQLAELRHRIFKKQPTRRRDTKLLDTVRKILIQEELRTGVRKLWSGRAMLVKPAGVKGVKGPTSKTVH